LENGANVNLENLFYDSEMGNPRDRPTLLIYAADNLAYMGQEITRGGVLFNNGVNIKCDYYNKSILAYIISNYNRYVESVKEFVYKVIEEDEENVGNYYDDEINKIGEVTLEDVEKCLIDTKNKVQCAYANFVNKHIEKIREYETRYLDRKNEDRKNKTDEQILAEITKNKMKKTKQTFLSQRKLEN
jgi:Ni,Fe-hydrogenase I large subunit